MKYLLRTFGIFVIAGNLLFLFSCSGSPTDSHHKKNNGKDKPLITSFTPSQGPGGTIVTIRGRRFSSTVSDNTVKFGGKSAIIISADISKLQVKMPMEIDPGKVAITVAVNGQTSSISKGFLVTPPPSITSITPRQGPTGKTVVINGQNFSATASRDTVRFNNIKAKVDSAASNQLKVTVPKKLDPGIVSVSVTIGGYTAEAPQEFTVTKPSFTSTHPYNLNVIYFTPSNNGTKPNYKERISKVLLNIQNFYRKWMKHWGYGSRSFGLLTDHSSGRVKIIHIEGNKLYSDYPYDGGGGKVIKEVNAYFEMHSNEKTSDHYLVIMPSWPGQEGGVPFYGLGNGWCFAVDNKYMDVDYLRTGGTKGSKATKWIGGLAHELGHGLNLPHDSYKVSEHQKYGMALMDSGNYTYGESPTFLTKASCAILSVNQVFSKMKDSFYGPVNASLKKLSGHFRNGDIIVSGSYESDTPVSSVIIYNDPKGRSNYDAVPWVTKPVAADSFHVQMPISQLPDHNNKAYSLYIRFVFQNGSLRRFSASNYNFVNGKPDINFQYGARAIYPRNDWKIIGFDSQEVTHDGLAKYVLDSNYDTNWHSQWSVSDPPGFPHWLAIDMNKKLEVHGFEFVQRQDERRNIKDLTIKISNDGKNWQSLGNFQLDHTSLPQSVSLKSPKKFRYFKLITHSAWDGSKFSALAEVGAY